MASTPSVTTTDAALAELGELLRIESVSSDGAHPAELREAADTGKPTGHDWTLDSIFVVALSIPVILGLLTLIDIARGRHTQRHDH